MWCACQRESFSIYFLGIIWVLVHGSLVLLFALSSFSGIVFLGSIWLTGIIVVGSMRHSGIFWRRCIFLISDQARIATRALPDWRTYHWKRYHKNGAPTILDQHGDATLPRRVKIGMMPYPLGKSQRCDPMPPK